MRSSMPYEFRNPAEAAIVLGLGVSVAEATHGKHFGYDKRRRVPEEACISVENDLARELSSQMSKLEKPRYTLFVSNFRVYARPTDGRNSQILLGFNFKEARNSLRKLLTSH